ncbi:type II toxin-antitoxin system prevent-host-death family antitoxin [Modestobacter sp. I12A-02628]|uniref:Type II toxin-antitoxin system prevent-host-death family antitoxin n=1 Tax=Goekera deserti TaxID=2497753 RepID=A0A7K3WJ29_9ACTN|nr:type II toxin-antitoxin system prevent-host-death family antitoxin [Goekera deserti]MPQ99295.1 type II toxin-antitoxin system prevent-host-death family antitoxin [Goekera deserti]NDI50294.1 type II toxin-antitoxin system prevent-host-death family antitoxin [Goekera deserti]NEL56454.1 type II toxin-antitoxin system prevent-host-death family antitoxin [Goekera deserti]
MERIGVRELRQNASVYLARVKSGETIEVTERGVLVALLTPPSPAASARERLIAEGRLIPATGPRVLPPRVAPPPGHPTASEALAAERADDR